ncbi:MAG TPA: class I SAM-dependent methyltransferase [Candidatus Dormibacteraeota bacterium]|nr:class I SAM-dependent methyltransferase [Candidatus Dormibacteraeota bacterium]
MSERMESAHAYSQSEVHLSAWNLADRDRRETQFDLLRDDFNLWFDEAVRRGGLDTHPATAAWRALDVGCGRGQFAREILARYPGAHVTAFDLDADQVADAAARFGGPRLRFAIHDACQPLPADLAGDGFDVVVAWMVLLWVPDKVAMLRHLAAALRPGGVVLLGNVPRGFFQHPHPTVSRLFTAGQEALRRDGAVEFTDQLDGHLREVGLEPLASVRPRFPVGGATAWGQRWWRHWLAALTVARPAIVDVHRLMDGEEFDGNLRALAPQSMVDQPGHFDHLYTLACKPLH